MLRKKNWMQYFQNFSNKQEQHLNAKYMTLEKEICGNTVFEKKEATISNVR